MVRRSTDPALDNRDRELLRTLESWGWYVTKVMAGDGEPAFAYSLGLFENLQHPEIVIFGLNLNDMHSIINTVGTRIREGQTYVAGKRYSDLLVGYECEFRTVPSERYNDILTYTLWYYEGVPFPALQLV